MENEAWLDAELGPKLRELAKLCGERGMSFVAVVEYGPGERSRTTRLAPDAGLAMRMLTLCAAAGENVDGYMINLIRYCREKGVDTSASMVMRLMGSTDSGEVGK
jgi:hypothetical protein